MRAATMLSRLLALPLLLLLGAAPRVARGQPASSPPVHPATNPASGPTVPPGARPHLEAAEGHFARGEYAQAAAELRAALRLVRQPAILYALAQAERLGGDCRRAIQHYEEFLRTGPPPRRAAFARQNLTRCRETAADARPPATAPASLPSAPARPVLGRPAVPPPVLPPRPPARPWWYGHRVTGALAVAGLLVLTTGTVLFAEGKTRIDRANAADTLDAFARDAAGAEGLQLAGAVTMIAGGSLLATALVRYALPRRREGTSIAATPTPAGGMLVVRRSF